MRLIASFLIVMAASVGHAAAEDLEIGGQKVSVTGFGISKSTSGRLVNVLADDPLAQAQKTIKGVYIPAGTRLAFLDRSYRDTQGRMWNLVSTEDGILAYVRAGMNGRGSQYWTQDQIGKFFAAGADQIAVVQAPQTIKTDKYGAISLTASEIYRVDPEAPQDNGQVPLVLDRSKLGDAWSANQTIFVPEQVVALISPETFRNAGDLEQPFTEYDPAREVLSAVDTALQTKTLPDAAAVRRRVQDFLTSRFITSKSCESEISFSLDTEAEAALGLSGLLSPVEAKLKLTGSIAGATRYTKGEEFDIVRVRQADNPYIYEIKTSSNRPDCASAPKSRITVAGTDGVRGEINEANLEEAGFGDKTQGSPVYTCRAEFFALRDILANKAFLPQTISTFVVANLAEFRGASDPSTCAANK